MLVDRGSLLRKVSDRQLMSESINFNSISNMIYGIGSSIDISVRSVLRESRPGFPARGHDSESKRRNGGMSCLHEFSLRMHTYIGLQACFARKQTMLAGYEDSMQACPACMNSLSECILWSASMLRPQANYARRI